MIFIVYIIFRKRRIKLVRENKKRLDELKKKEEIKKQYELNKKEEDLLSPEEKIIKENKIVEDRFKRRFRDSIVIPDKQELKDKYYIEPKNLPAPIKDGQALSRAIEKVRAKASENAEEKEKEREKGKAMGKVIEKAIGNTQEKIIEEPRRIPINKSKTRLVPLSTFNEEELRRNRVCI